MLLILLSIVLTLIIIVVLSLSLKNKSTENLLLDTGLSMMFTGMKNNFMMRDEAGNMYIWYKPRDGDIDTVKNRAMEIVQNMTPSDWKDPTTRILSAISNSRRCQPSALCSDDNCKNYSMIRFPIHNSDFYILPLYSNKISDLYKSLLKISTTQSVYIC